PDLLLPLVGAIFGATVLQAVCSYSVLQLISKEGHRMVADLRRKVMSHVLRLPVTYFDSAKAGALASRVLADAESTRHLMGYSLVEFVGGIATAVIALVYLLQVSFVLTVTALAAGVIFTLLSKENFKRLRPVLRDMAMASSEVTGRLTETLGGIRV